MQGTEGMPIGWILSGGISIVIIGYGIVIYNNLVALKHGVSKA